MSHKNELQSALDDLPKLTEQTERQRIETLSTTLDALNNGDAMAYFDDWLATMRQLLGLDIDTDSDPLTEMTEQPPSKGYDDFVQWLESDGPWNDEG